MRIVPRLLAVSLAMALILAPALGASAEETTDPALTIFTIAPHTDVVHSCPPGRQVYFVQAIIEHQTIPVTLLDAAGKPIQEEVFTSAHGFRLDRAHEHPVRVMLTCGK